MVDAQTHRGPDDRGTVTFPDEGLALGMRRLSVVDIEGGKQPMHGEAKRVWIVFNGEIYNAPALRRELVAAGHRFQTDHSDTEAVLHGFEEWGDDVFSRLNGMFALAIWDRESRRLVLARDRAGEKPLYIGKLKHGFAFASELKGLLRHPGVRRDIDPTALAQYLSFDFMLGSTSILQGTEKLPPAHHAHLTADSYTTTRYWHPAFQPRSCATLDDAVGALDDALDLAVKRRMIADVPIGLFLSGGLDSSTVGYYMTRHSGSVSSFSIGFEESSHDESAYAQRVASHLGTEHYVQTLTSSAALELLPKVAEVLDEPMGDTSLIPTYLLSSFTRRHVTVALGGDGSDEILMGYRNYRPLRAAWSLRRAPAAVKVTTGRIGSVATKRLTGRGASHRAAALAASITAPPAVGVLNTIGAFHGDAIAYLSEDVRRSVNSSLSAPLTAGTEALSGPDGTVDAYLRGYLSEDILVKVDRASMAASLEVRAPFLDADLLDLILALPWSYRLRRMSGKYVLRRLMAGRVPDEVLRRPKHGFAVPIGGWLRGPLRPLLDDYLNPTALKRGGHLEPTAVTRVVDDHLSGRRDRGRQLWLLLLFELWRDTWLRR